MKVLVFALFALAVASAAEDDVFRFSPLKQPIEPVYAKTYAQPLLSQQYYQKPSAYAQPLFSQQYYQKPSAYAQPLYSSNVYSKYVHEPAYYQPYQHLSHVPTYSSSLVEKYHHAHHAPVYSGLAYAPHQYIEKIEKVQHHAPLISHAFGQPALSTYSAFQKPAAYQYEKFQHAAVPSTYAAAYSGPQFRILEQVQDIDPQGNYHFAYSTENGIQASEQSVLKGIGVEGPVSAKEGSYSYTGPDGVVYTVNWVADENGYRASGAHLPQVPEEIKRSLEFNAAHPSIEESLKK